MGLLYADNIVLMEELRKDLQCVKTEGACVLCASDEVEARMYRAFCVGVH